MQVRLDARDEELVVCRGAVARIINAAGDPIGAGVMATPRALFTCTHVLQNALSIDGSDLQGKVVRLDFPLLPTSGAATARICLAVPPDSDDCLRDIAVLELTSESGVEGVRSARFLDVDRPWWREFRSFGFPIGVLHGIWARGRQLEYVGKNRLQIEPDGSVRIQQGFSGAAVWDCSTDEVTGLISDAGKPGASAGLSALAIPTHLLQRAFDSCGIGYPTPPSLPLEALAAAAAKSPGGSEAARLSSDLQRTRRYLVATAAAVLSALGVTAAVDSSSELSVEFRLLGAITRIALIGACGALLLLLTRWWRALAAVHRALAEELVQSPTTVQAEDIDALRRIARGQMGRFR